MMYEDRIGLGTVQFGQPYGVSNSSGQTQPEEVSKILAYARKQNILLLDTASAYGNAEKVLGQNDLNPFRVVSKFMSLPDGPGIRRQLETSLEELGVDSLYGYLAHRPLSLLRDSKQWEILQSIQNQGIVEKIGFSLYRPEELTGLLNSGFVPDLIQIPYNYVDRRFEKQARLLKEKGCEVHARSAFLQGLFFRKPETLQGYFDEVKPLIRSLQTTADRLPGALLRFVLQQPFIDRVIIGVENSSQLAENLDSLKSAGELPEPESDISEKILIPSNWPAPNI